MVERMCGCMLCINSAISHLKVYLDLSSPFEDSYESLCFDKCFSETHTCLVMAYTSILFPCNYVRLILRFSLIKIYQNYQRFPLINFELSLIVLCDVYQGLYCIVCCMPGSVLYYVVYTRLCIMCTSV